jgi:hypothetical protein
LVNNNEKWKQLESGRKELVLWLDESKGLEVWDEGSEVVIRWEQDLWREKQSEALAVEMGLKLLIYF